MNSIALRLKRIEDALAAAEEPTLGELVIASYGSPGAFPKAFEAGRAAQQQSLCSLIIASRRAGQAAET